MKAFLGIALAALLQLSVFGVGMMSVEVDDSEYTNISDVHISGNGRIFISAGNGMTVVSSDKLPDDFLQSWNINRDAATAAEKDKKEKVLTAAISAGYFREVAGVVYDIRNPESGWTHFPEAKIIQISDDGALVDAAPESEDYMTVHVRNLPGTVSDTDTIDFTAKQTGNFNFVSVLGEDRTVRDYDMGKVCARSEIPESVLSGQKAFDVVVQSGSPDRDVLASLPEGSDLKANGSGFFITADGYFVTNYHVVKDANSVKIKNGDDVYAAKIVHVDEDNDLALLKVSGQFKPLSIFTNDVQLGEGVFTIGFPDILLQGTQPKYTDGKISSLAGLQDDPKDYQVSVPVQPGNSGGPLVDMNGSVVGIIVAKLDNMAALSSSGDLPQNVNYAIKARCLSDFLAQFPEVKMDPVKTGSVDSVVQATQRSVAIVLIY